MKKLLVLTFLLVSASAFAEITNIEFLYQANSTLKVPTNQILNVEISSQRNLSRNDRNSVVWREVTIPFSGLDGLNLNAVKGTLNLGDSKAQGESTCGLIAGVPTSSYEQDSYIDNDKRLLTIEVGTYMLDDERKSDAEIIRNHQNCLMSLINENEEIAFPVTLELGEGN